MREHFRKNMTDYCDNFLTGPIAYDGQPDAATRSDWCHSGLGPQWGPGEPQRAATLEQTARGQVAWNRIIDKARRIIADEIEDTRLADYVASHRPSKKTMATIIHELRTRRWRKQKQD